MRESLFSKIIIYSFVLIIFTFSVAVIVPKFSTTNSEESNTADITEATITVHHYEKGTVNRVHQDDVYHVNFNEQYNTNPYSTEELSGNYQNNYHYNNYYVGDATSGIVGKANYVITYYYELREAEIITHYYI